MLWTPILRRLLTAASDALERTPGGLPPRRMLYHGSQPPADCPHGLAVWAANIALSKNFPVQWSETMGCAPGRSSADVTVWWVRPWPTMRQSPMAAAPAVEAEDAAAELLLADAESMLSLLPGWNLDAAGDTTEIRCLYGALNPLPPSGGIAGWRWPLTIELPV